MATVFRGWIGASEPCLGPAHSHSYAGRWAQTGLQSLSSWVQSLDRVPMLPGVAAARTALNREAEVRPLGEQPRWRVAQQAKRPAVNRKVAGSIPAMPALGARGRTWRTPSARSATWPCTSSTPPTGRSTLAKHATRTSPTCYPHERPCYPQSCIGFSSVRSCNQGPRCCHAGGVLRRHARCLTSPSSNVRR